MINFRTFLWGLKRRIIHECCVLAFRSWIEITRTKNVEETRRDGSFPQNEATFL